MGWSRAPLGQFADPTDWQLGMVSSGRLADLGDTHRGQTWTAGHLAHLAGHIGLRLGVTLGGRCYLTAMALRGRHVVPAAS